MQPHERCECNEQMIEDLNAQTMHNQSKAQQSRIMCAQREVQMPKQKPKLIIIAGPTAVGKSDVAVALAKRIDGEVISADSMQVYRGMDIGSAKITKKEMDGVLHHLIDVMDPHENYNVVRFQQMAKAAAADILSRGKIPILCGGTGFYIQAFLYDIDFTEEAPSEGILAMEKALWQEAARTGGKEALHERLAAVDPASAAAIPLENAKRVIRALLFYEQHGTTISSHNAEQAMRKTPEHCVYDARFFVLTDKRSRLYERIDARVDAMMQNGFLEEVRKLKESGVPRDGTAMQGIGYRELYTCLQGELSLEEAVALIKKNSRHYAKRQLTWFRREPGVIWIDRSERAEHSVETKQHRPEKQLEIPGQHLETEYIIDELLQYLS